MSVISERSCGSPMSSTGSHSCNTSALKLKRRWIEMSSLDDEVENKKVCSHETPVKNVPRRTVIRMPPQAQHMQQAVKPVTVRLPDDPRNWLKRDVLHWLKYMTTAYDIDVSADKFDMNGKALCMMTIEMFVQRVPVGGKLLYRDFRLRLHRAVFFQEQPTPDYSRMSPLELLTLTAGKYFS